VISERAELLKGLRAMPVVLRTLIRGIPDGALRHRPEPDEWAIVEVVAHLADTDERTLGRLQRMLAEDEPQLPAYDQAALAVERGYIRSSVEAELDRFEAIRTEQVELLAALDDGGWRRIGHHAEHGPITVQQLTAHSVGEDMDHLAQIARLVRAATSGSPSSGP
jgi:hypothetical protein